jgi:hypothetical protein
MNNHIISSIHNRHILRGYQTAGGTESGKHLPSRRLFDVAEILSPEDTEDIFEDNPPNDKKGDKGLIRIDAEL